MVDHLYQEVAGLGATVTGFIYKSGGGGFNPVINAVAEIGNGWYTLLLTAAECDTIGPLAFYAPAVGIAIQQNLEYVVQQRNDLCIEFTYTLTNLSTGLPIEGAKIWFTTDAAGHNIIWNGKTDVFGIARDHEGNLPCVDQGTYYVWAKKAGLIANAWPDTENVSP